jgi:hypothetical protein
MSQCRYRRLRPVTHARKRLPPPAAPTLALVEPEPFSLQMSGPMLIDNTEVTSMIQAASSQGRKLLKHQRWALRLSLEIHQ